MDHCVNYRQSPHERRQKYALLRSFGVHYSWARAAKDWRWSTIQGYLRTIGVLGPTETLDYTPEPSPNKTLHS